MTCFLFIIAYMKKEITVIQLTPMQISSQIQTLVDTIRDEIENGKERAYLAMEQEKRLIYWNVGKHIKEHLLQNADRAEYGDSLIVQLADELGLAKTLLYDSVQFYEEYPDIFHAHGKLTWTHIRMLLTIQEKQLRQTLEAEIVSENLSSRDLQKLLRNNKNPQKEPQIPILKTSRGKPYTYRLKKKRDKQMVDLGFRVYVENPLVKDGVTKTGRPTKDNTVQVEKGEQDYKFTNMDKGVVPYYTYKAYVLEIIDGDTIWVDIDLGFNTWTMQKLRLRGINTKEIETAEGQSAKDYIEARLNQCKFIAIKTYYRDKFSRYLADVFFIKRETDLDRIVEEGTFLNQELLDEGLAVKY